jgi:hypothetical protein
MDELYSRRTFGSRNGAYRLKLADIDKHLRSLIVQTWI